MMSKRIKPRMGITPASVISAGLMLGGLASDGLAGLLVLQQQVVLGWSLHLAAVGIWAVGIAVLTAPVRPKGMPVAQTARALIAAHLGGWPVAAAIIGGLLFPGLGTGSVSLAFGASYLFRRRTLPRYALATTQASMKVVVPTKSTDNQANANDIVPLIDVLRQDQTEVRQAVVRALGDQGDQKSVAILHRLLTDANPDVRGDAAVILTRLENDFQQQIQKALHQIEADPADAEERLQLARLYMAFAASGLLDPLSRRFYLEKAERILSQASAAQPGRFDILLDKAQVAYRLDHAREAIDLLTALLRQRRYDYEAVLLLLEVAFAEQEWGIVLSLAQDDHLLKPEQQALLQWWAEIIPPSASGVTHG